ncbi:unnamed protein product [Rhizoctonia solani]|uniref:F-box domain-containing protein n=1 Tax=Rhizoctonia solani TaxID=456999 RepID=A0A8H2ZYA8_9AGAM|nr:unnamed protein product [Rhizoctonia solani]
MAPTTRSSKRRIADTSLAAPEPHGQTAAVPQGDAYNEQSDEEQSDAETEAEPAKKRARRTRKEKDDYRPPKQTKVKGKLQIFKNLPVEVFIGIAKYLHPFDLVLLSRVNKFFRELFMSRQATSIWISARLNVPGLPPCPPELCEPQYAALIFTKMCSYCGKYAPRHMDSILLVRLCSSCRDRQYKLIPAIRERIFDLSLLPQSRELIPRNFRPYGWLCLSSDADAVESKLNELEATGDEEALARWKVERRKAVQDRDANAEHFRSWFAARDQERGIELVQQKDAHQVE